MSTSARFRLFLLAALLGAFLLPGGVGAQSTEARDLEDLVSLVTEVHPAASRYTTLERLKQVMEAEVGRLEAVEQPTDLDLALSIHRVLAMVGDAHFAVGLRSFQPGARSGAFLLPLLPKRIGDRVFVDASEPSFPPGTELLEVDGRSALQLVDELASIAFVDGDRPAARRARVERDFTLHFHIGHGVADEYAVRVRLPDGEERAVTLPAVGPAELGALQASRISKPLWGEPASQQPALPWVTRLDGGARLLRLPSFGVVDADLYRERVDALMDEADGTEPLVIDLRGNDGGFRTNGIAVLERLIVGEYAQWSRIEVVTKQMLERFGERVTFPFGAQSLESFPGERRDGRYVSDGDPLSSMMRGAGPHHSGRIIVFVDDGTNSAAVEMVVALRAARPDVVIVGTETKGECGRHVGEIPILFTGRSGVRVILSLAAITHVPARGCRLGRGVEPDVEVVYSVEDFLNGVDPYLRALREVLEG